MLTPRIFIGAAQPPPAVGTRYVLQDASARHVAQALRMRAGSSLALFTGTGGEYAARIVDIGRRDVTLDVERHEAIERESPAAVTLVQSIIANDMMDFVVRKAVELGVAAIAPVQSARSQRIPALREERRIQHWQQIAVAACEQCGRNRVPDVRHIVPFGDWLDSVQSGHIVILDADAGHSLAAVALQAMPALVAIGPEGGFTLEEVQSATNRGASAVHLGGRMLRAETAALAALATVNAVAGDAR